MTAPESPAGAGCGEAPTPAGTYRPLVIGLDLSATSTGVAGYDWAETVKGGSLPKTATRQQHWDRIRVVRRGLVDYIDNAVLVVMEGPSYGSNDRGAHERAFLWWWAAGRCFTRNIPLAVVAPTTLKVYATGGGRASKEDVVQEVQRRRPDVSFRGNDQADALTLAAMGLDYLGHDPVRLPATHRRALESVDWPEVTL